MGIWVPDAQKEGKVLITADRLPIMIPANSSMVFSVNTIFSILDFLNPTALNIANSCLRSSTDLKIKIPIPSVPMIKPIPPNKTNTFK